MTKPYTNFTTNDYLRDAGMYCDAIHGPEICLHSKSWTLCFWKVKLNDKWPFHIHQHLSLFSYYFNFYQYWVLRKKWNENCFIEWECVCATYSNAWGRDAFSRHCHYHHSTSISHSCNRHIVRCWIHVLPTTDDNVRQESFFSPWSPPQQSQQKYCQKQQ